MPQPARTMPFELKSLDKEEGTFEGIASPYGELDGGDDITMPGAFTKSLQRDFKDRGRLVPMLWQHQKMCPIGVYPVLEDGSKHLKVKGACNMKVQQGREAHALMDQGALSGLSYGYTTLDHDFVEGGKVRRLKELRLFEISPVTFPMADNARVTLVKSLEEAGNLSDCETLLRDAGFTKSEATAFVCRVKALSVRSDSADADASSLQRALQTLRNR